MPNPKKLPKVPPLLRRPAPTATHEVRLVLTRHGEAWGEVELAVQLAPFANDVAQHLTEIEHADLISLMELGCAAAREIEQRKHTKNAPRSGHKRTARK